MSRGMSCHTDSVGWEGKFAALTYFWIQDASRRADWEQVSRQFYAGSGRRIEMVLLGGQWKHESAAGFRHQGGRLRWYFWMAYGITTLRRGLDIRDTGQMAGRHEDKRG